MKHFLSFCFCVLAFSKSIEDKNKELTRTNQVLLQTLRELAVGEDDYCKTGRYQSPIALPTSMYLKKRRNKLLVDDIEGPQQVKWEEVEDGSGRMGWKLNHGTVQRKLQYGYGPLHTMKSFIIVAPSEHTISGKAYDAELQISFDSWDYNYPKLKMSIMLEIGDNEELESFWIPLMQSLSPFYNNPYYPINLGTLFSQLTLDKYYRYHGSETSGSFSENIEWIIMGDLLKVDYMLMHLLKLKDGQVTPRKTQLWCGREVEYDSEIRLLWPEAAVREEAIAEP